MSVGHGPGGHSCRGGSPGLKVTGKDISKIGEALGIVPDAVRETLGGK